MTIPRGRQLENSILVSLCVHCCLVLYIQTISLQILKGIDQGFLVIIYSNYLSKEVRI